jgi:MFS family permease
MVAGLVVALMFATIESWLAASIHKGSRGEVLSVYMVLTKAALAIGPYLAFSYTPAAAEPWMIAAGIGALSMLPVCFTSAEQPPAPKAQPLALVEQFATAPAAVIASFGAGLVNSGVLTLAPLYASQHYGPGAATEFYSAAWIGSLLLQWPAGKLSDRFDRRMVIAALTALAATAALALAVLGGQAPKGAAIFIFFCWGAGGLSFYGLAVAHMADRAEPHRLAQSAAGLLFVWAAGSILGPMVQGPLVDWFGIEGVFWFAGAAALFVTVAMFWRRNSRASPAPTTKAEVAPQMGASVAAGEIAYGEEDAAADPRVQRT